MHECRSAQTATTNRKRFLSLPSMGMLITHSVFSSNTLVGRAMHCYVFRRLCLQVFEWRCWQVQCSQDAVCLAPKLQPIPRFHLPKPNTHAVALRLLQPAGVEVSQLWVPGRMPGKRESRVWFGRSKACDLWQLVCGVQGFFSPLVFQSPSPSVP